MTQITGTVNEIKSRETRAGTFYDVVVDGKAYGVGKYAPRGIQQGDVVTFEYETRQNGQYTNYNVKSRTLRKVDEGSGASAPTVRNGGNSSASGSASTGVQPARSKYEPFDERQEIISKQAALNSALAFGNLAIEAGAILVPKSAKDNEKLALVQNWVFTEAAKFFNATTGRTWDIQLSETVETPKELAKSGRKTAAAPAPESEDTGSDEWQDDDLPF